MVTVNSRARNLNPGWLNPFFSRGNVNFSSLKVNFAFNPQNFGISGLKLPQPPRALLTVRAEILAIFRSFFVRNGDFINLF